MPAAVVTYCLNRRCGKPIKVEPAYLLMDTERCSCDVPRPQFEGCKLTWDGPNAGPGADRPEVGK